MTATGSTAQEAAYERGDVPPAERVRDGVLAIALPMPGRDLPFSLCYAIEAADGSLHLIDSGMDTRENLGLLDAAVRTVGHTIEDIASVTATHAHHDHVGLARRIRDVSGASVGLHRRDAEWVNERSAGAEVPSVRERMRSWAVPADHIEEVAAGATQGIPPVRVPVDRELEDGDLLDIPGRRLRVMHTPGHTAGHIVVRDEDEGIQFAGDHLLPISFPGLGLDRVRDGDDPIGDYQAALAAVAAHPDDEVCPGHGFRFTGVVERSTETSAHHARRTAEIAAAIDSHPSATVWQIASQVSWTAGWSHLRGLHLYSALSQTALHLAHLTRIRT